jgi:hypothetical protein
MDDQEMLMLCLNSKADAIQELLAENNFSRSMEAMVFTYRQRLIEKGQKPR